MEQPRIIVDPESWIEIVVPPFATDDEAIRRSRRIERGELPVLEMTGDFHGPLFGELNEADLPASLRVELDAWQRHWESAWAFPGGWRSDKQRLAWCATGEDLFSRVERALWHDYIIDPVFRINGRRGDFVAEDAEGVHNSS